MLFFLLFLSRSIINKFQRQTIQSSDKKVNEQKKGDSKLGKKCLIKEVSSINSSNNWLKFRYERLSSRLMIKLNSFNFDSEFLPLFFTLLLFLFLWVFFSVHLKKATYFQSFLAFISRFQIPFLWFSSIFMCIPINPLTWVRVCLAFVLF